MKNIKLYCQDEIVILNLEENMDLLHKYSFKKIASKAHEEESKLIFGTIKFYYLETIIKQIETCAIKYDRIFEIDPSVIEYINKRKLNIDKYSKEGKTLKQYGVVGNEEYLKFQKIINNNLSRTLYQEQFEMAYHMYKVKRVMNFSVPGSGKTSMVYGLFSYLSDQSINEVDRVVVFCPKNAFKAWIDEFRINFLNTKELRYLTADDDKIEVELELFAESYNLILINYEKIQKLSNGKMNKIMNERNLIVFDEVHRIKNPDGIRGLLFKEEIKSNGYMVALTGTPIPNGYQDIENILSILFRDEFDLMDISKYSFKSLTQQQKFEVNHTLDPFFGRVTKEKLGVPKINKDIYFKSDLTEEEKELVTMIMYKDFNPLVKIVRMMQFLSTPNLMSNSVDSEMKNFAEMEFLDSSFSDSQLMQMHNIGISTKMKRLLEESSKIIKDEKPLLIWCIFKMTMKEIVRLLQEKHPDKKIKFINGDVSLQDREMIIDKMNSGNVDVLVANPQTLAESVSLHKRCHDAIYFEINYDLAKYLQSRDRIHRLGLSEGQYTQYYHFYSNVDKNKEYYFEERIYSKLIEKEQEINAFLNSDTYVFDSPSIDVGKNSKNIIEEMILKLQEKFNSN